MSRRVKILLFSLSLLISVNPMWAAGEESDKPRVIFGVDLSKVKKLASKDFVEVVGALPLPLTARILLSGYLIASKIYPMVKADTITKEQVDKPNPFSEVLDSADSTGRMGVLQGLLVSFTIEDTAEKQVGLAGLILAVSQSKKPEEMLKTVKDTYQAFRVQEEAGVFEGEKAKQGSQQERALVSMLVNLYDRLSAIEEIVKLAHDSDPDVSEISLALLVGRWTQLSPLKFKADLDKLSRNEELNEALAALLPKIQANEAFQKTRVNKRILAASVSIGGGIRWLSDQSSAAQTALEGLLPKAQEKLGHLRDSVVALGSSENVTRFRQAAGDAGSAVKGFLKGCGSSLWGTKASAYDASSEGGKVVEVEVIYLPAPKDSANPPPEA
jgi:hypothetical protein